MREDLTLAIAIFAVSVLYSAVGQAGGSGYLAVMGFAGTAPEVMRPTALLLNVLVAGVATVRFHRAGLLDLAGFWPLLLGSVPCAAIGGMLHLPRAIYSPLVGVMLLCAAVPLIWSRKILAGAVHDRPPKIGAGPAIAAGGGVGLLAGVTGTGGGFLLSPLLLLTGWAPARRVAAVSTALILLNSATALAGNVASVGSVPASFAVWSVAVLIGGLLGAELGSRWLPSHVLIRLLAVLQVAGGVKLLLWP